VNKLRASPAARATARQLGIDLAALAGAGSGPLGRITKADVQALSQGGAGTAPAAAGAQAATTTKPATGAPTPAPTAALTQPTKQPTPSYADAVTPAAGSTYELTRIEQVSARLTARSFQDVPHFYVTLKVDVTDAVQRLRALPEHLKVSINDALVKVTALALELHPRLNSTLAENTLQLHTNIYICVITATENGVITSVVPGAASAGLTQIRTRVREVRARLQSGQAQASDVSGATFCISNMGMFGVDSFSAIILQPNVAILAVGTLKEEVLVKEGKMYLGQTMALTVSADHRALDGVAVALFLKDMEKLLQEPERWLGA
jgi:pyruvate dehydrogenase E2 component (dihydrolipoamide acetyltransferase)